jgi:hypothetical protein
LTLSFLTEWTTAKLNFETATQRKKPTETFLAFFRQSSGLEDALKAVDKAVTANDLKALKAAFGEYVNKLNKYQIVLGKAIDKEDNAHPGSDFVNEGQLLQATLGKIQRKIYDKVKELAPKDIEVGNYTADWKAAKRRFKEKTGRSKPSAKPDEMFRKGSGVESSLEAVDRASHRNDGEAFKAAATAYDKAVSSYKPVLEGIERGEQDGETKKVLKGLIDNLVSIQGRIQGQVKKLAGQ